MNRRIFAALLLLACAACASDAKVGAGERTGTVTAAITAPVITPVPCLADSTGTYHSQWNGTIPELYFADAMAQCTSGVFFPRVYDLYAQAILLMAGETLFAMPQNNVNPVTFSGQWASLRANASNSCDPTTMKPTGVAVTLKPVSQFWVQDPSLEPMSGTPPNSNAEEYLLSPDINFCVASLLRSSEPGGASGQVLLFSDADQRELLEIIRERAQMAMLQYALLGNVFARPNPVNESDYAAFTATFGGPFAGSATMTLLELERLGWNEAQWTTHAPTQLQIMGQHFAAAVQLHTYVTEELASLLARSRSARLPRTPQSLALADDLSGESSWFQREMVMMFGGDPLATSDGSGNPSAGWTNPAGDVNPSAVGAPQWVWPTYAQAPYVRTALTSPQVKEFMGLARRFNEITLTPTSGGNIAGPTFDPVLTATNLYQNVEFDLEVHNCATTANGCCALGGTCPSSPRALPAGNTVDNSWLLWRDYRITPDHATTAANYLVDALSTCGTAPSTAGSGCNVGFLTLPMYGAMSVGGADANGGASFDPATGHLSPQAVLYPRPLTELATAYTANTPIRFAAAEEMTSFFLDDGALGFNGFCNPAQPASTTDPTSPASYSCSQSALFPRSDDAARTMGAISAQAATRDMLLSALDFIGKHANDANPSNTPVLSSYFAHANQIIGVINGAIGSSLTVSQDPVQTLVHPLCGQQCGLTLSGHDASGTLLWQTPPPEAAHAIWDVTLTFDAGDPWWSSMWKAGASTYALYALSDSYGADLALHPEAKIGTGTIANDVQSAVTANFWSGAPGGSAGTVLRQVSNTGVVSVRFQLPFPSGGVSLVAARTTGSVTDYRLVAGNLSLWTAPTYSLAAFTGQYLAGGGSFGALILHQASSSSVNPAQAAYDGFDIPNPWVPPFNAALLGGNATDTSVTTFMSLAQTAATNAATAVDTALQAIQQQQQDQATAQAAAVEASQSVQQDRDALCGAGNTACDTGIVQTSIATIAPGIYPTPPTPSWSASHQCNTGDVNCQLDALVFNYWNDLENTTFAIADAVATTLAQPGAPSFTAYSGGSLAAAFIAQWQALRAPADKITAVISTVSTAKGQVAAAQALLDSQTGNAAQECSAAAFANAAIAGSSTGQSIGFSVSVSAGFPSGGSVSAGVNASWSKTYSPGPSIAQQDKCATLQGQLSAQQAQAASSLMSAFSDVSNALVGFTDSVASIASAGASIAQLIQDAKLADARAQLESSLASTSLQSFQGIYRVYRSSDMWRAKALIDNARRYALGARRAIEARYVVDLTRMDQPEPFVASPSLWADQVYTYDLNMPTAVGLSVSQGSTGMTIYSNQVVDYVANLQAFLAGYTAKRPAAVASDEIDVVTLPGFMPSAPASSTTSDGGTDGGDAGNPSDAGDAGSASTVSVAGATAEWMVHCPTDPSGKSASAGTWIAVPASPNTSVNQACQVNGAPVHPDEARLEFSLDPWGRLNSGIESPPFVDRFNARWGNLALNFVGTGVKDCTQAADPQGCFNDSFIVYNLTQNGPSWVTDYDEVWTLLNTPSTTIEGAKGLAAELWLNPLQSGWSTPYISAVARTELTLAPLGGSYVLDFLVPPEVVLGNIERIQLLVGSAAWVKQSMP